MDGLFWKTEYKKEPIAYGVNKLVIGCVVEDEKVSTDDLQEKMEAFEDLVQSVDIAAFNKIWAPHIMHIFICWISFKLFKPSANSIFSSSWTFLSF